MKQGTNALCSGAVCIVCGSLQALLLAAGVSSMSPAPQGEYMIGRVAGPEDMANDGPLRRSRIH